MPLGVRRYSPQSFTPSSGTVLFYSNSFFLRHNERYLKETQSGLEDEQNLSMAASTTYSDSMLISQGHYLGFI
jgi:hypothetical protein